MTARAMLAAAAGTTAAAGMTAVPAPAASGTFVQNGQVLIAGGEGFAGHTETNAATAELYTP